MKILIVEDEPQIAKGIECILAEQRYFLCHTQIVYNGQEALNVCKHFRTDLIITDIRMQMMNGLEMIKEIHKETFLLNLLLYLARGVYRSLPENYSKLEKRPLPNIPNLQFLLMETSYPAHS